MGESADVTKFEVILAKESDNLGIKFNQDIDKVFVQHVDPHVKILSVYPDEIKSIIEGDVVSAVNLTVLTDIDPGLVYKTLAAEIAKSQKIVKLKMERYMSHGKSSRAHSPNPFILNITNVDGEIVRLEVHAHDDIRQVLMSFIEKNKLPVELLNPLLKKVSDEFCGDESPIENCEKMSLDELKFNKLRETPLAELGVERAIRFSNKTQHSRQSSLHLQNQSFFDRLNTYEERKQDRLESLRQQVFQEREEYIRSSSFRVQLNNSEKMIRSPQSSEIGLQNLYYDHMLWLQTRDKNVNRLKAELEQRKEQELLSVMRPVPHLFTTTDMQRENSPSKKVLHQSLYEWNNYYKLRRENSTAKILSNIDKEAYFIPKIDERSRKLANKRISKMKRWLDRSSSDRCDPEYSNINPSIYEDDTPYINNPVGRYSFPTDSVLGTEDAETTKIYSPHSGTLDNANNFSLNADLDPIQSASISQQSFIINEVIINQLRDSPRLKRNASSNQWIDLVCEKKKHLLQKKLPEIQSSVSVDSKNEVSKKPPSVTSTPQKRSRSLSPLTCDSRNCVSNYRNFSYDTPPTTSSPKVVSSGNIDLSLSHILKNNSNNTHSYKSMDDMEDVFFRLYQDRKFRSEATELLRARNIPKFSHSPNIGKNHSYPVERKRDEFFKRLHQHHENQMMEQEKSKEYKINQILEMSNILMNNSKSFISVEESNQLADRLNRSLKKTETDNEHFRKKLINDIDLKARSKFIKSVSNRKVMNRYRKSLGEIFDVLKLSEEFEKQNFRRMLNVDSRKDEENFKQHIDSVDDESKTTNNQEMTESQKKGENFVDDLLIFEERTKCSSPSPVRFEAADELYPLLNLSEAESLGNVMKEKSDETNFRHAIPVQPTTKFVTVNSPFPINSQLPPEFIEVKYTNPFLLKPKLLADNIAIALNMFISEKKNIVSKEEFIEEMLRLMFAGKLTPFGYLLTPTEKRNDRKKKFSLRRSEDIEIEKHCTYHPQLKAQSMSTVLVKQRYSDRYSGKQKIEDSLLSYVPINARKLDSIRQEIEDDVKIDCTFQPFLLATHYREMRKYKQKQNRSRSVPPPGYYELKDDDFDNSNLQGVVSKPLEEWYNL